MKVGVVLLFVVTIHLAAGISTNSKKKNVFSDISKDNTQSINSNEYTSVPQDKVTFRLWTRNNSNLFSPLYHGRLHDEPSIRPNKPFKFMIHGWLGDANNKWYEYLKNEYLKKGDYNIVQVDWADPADNFYFISAFLTRFVGQHIGNLIVDLNQTLGVPFENIHIIGHSLGAHISGFAGKKVNNDTTKLVGRISGLDPAWPWFGWEAVFSGLNRNDASYVDVIHTNKGAFGYGSNLGHADFYPNGWYHLQPGCFTNSCSHSRVHHLFGESINSERFVARLCSTYEIYERGECQQNQSAIMGENIEVGTQGVYYLKTNCCSPYARNDEI